MEQKGEQVNNTTTVELHQNEDDKEDGWRAEAAGGFRVYRVSPDCWSYSARESAKPQGDSKTSGKQEEVELSQKNRLTTKILHSLTNILYNFFNPCRIQAHLVHLFRLTCCRGPSGWKSQLDRFLLSRLWQTVLEISKSTTYRIPLTIWNTHVMTE